MTERRRTWRQLAQAALYRQAALLRAWGEHIYRTPQDRRYQAWFAARGDHTLRLDYALGEDSIVFDLGGYEGQWAAEIFVRYCCTLFIFEPVPEFAESISRRFLRNPKVKVLAFGLAQRDMTTEIWLNRDSSSVHRGHGSLSCTGRFRCANDFLLEHGIACIDLMKINIEGGEYDLLEHLIDTEWIGRIRNLQIQFHDFVPNAEKRMRAIQARLARSHDLTYQYMLAWENWRLRDDASR